MADVTKESSRKFVHQGENMTVVSLHRRTLHLVLASLLTASAGALAASPVIDLSPTGVLQQLPRPQADPASVSIYEFRSGVSEINARAATDMFKTALVQSGQFRVVERSRLNEGVLREKQLNAQGQTSGQLAQKQLREAPYLFEGTISEAAISTRQDQGVISIG